MCSDAIAPCPWCGHEAEVLDYEASDFRLNYSVSCGDSCGGSGPGHRTEEEAIAEWNRVAEAYANWTRFTGDHEDAEFLYDEIEKLTRQLDEKKADVTRRCGYIKELHDEIQKMKDDAGYF